jgi:hypothetical protein
MFVAVVETTPDDLILSAGHPPACLNENLCRLISDCSTKEELLN